MKKQAKKQTKKFRTPHEQKATAKQEKTAEAKSSKRDAFNGILGTRCSKINVAVIEAGEAGATVKEVADKTGEDASLVSAQLGWIAKTKAELLTRKQEGKSYRYFAA